MDALGFLLDFRRLNVAITRAKKALIIFAHVSTLANSEAADHLVDLVQAAANSNSIFDESVLNIDTEMAVPRTRYVLLRPSLKSVCVPAVRFALREQPLRPVFLSVLPTLHGQPPKRISQIATSFASTAQEWVERCECNALSQHKALRMCCSEGAPGADNSPAAESLFSRNSEQLAARLAELASIEAAYQREQKKRKERFQQASREKLIHFSPPAIYQSPSCC